MGASLQALFPDVPNALIYVCLVFVMLPLVWSGMKVLAKFQAISLVLFVVFVVWAMRNAVALPASSVPLPAIQFGVGSFKDLLEVLGIVNGLAFIIGLVTADYARFVRKRELRAGTAFVGALFPAFCYGITGVLGSGSRSGCGKVILASTSFRCWVPAGSFLPVRLNSESI